MCPALWSCLGLEVHYGEISFALYSYFFGTWKREKTVKKLLLNRYMLMEKLKN